MHRKIKSVIQSLRNLHLFWACLTWAVTFCKKTRTDGIVTINHIRTIMAKHSTDFQLPCIDHIKAFVDSYSHQTQQWQHINLGTAIKFKLIQCISSIYVLTWIVMREIKCMHTNSTSQNGIMTYLLVEFGFSSYLPICRSTPSMGIISSSATEEFCLHMVVIHIMHISIPCKFQYNFLLFPSSRKGFIFRNFLVFVILVILKTISYLWLFYTTESKMNPVIWVPTWPWPESEIARRRGSRLLLCPTFARKRWAESPSFSMGY